MISLFKYRQKCVKSQACGLVAQQQYSSEKCGIAENVDFRKCRIGAQGRTRIRASFLQENSKLNETRYFSVSFKHSYKCGITENVDFRKCCISAQASQRARKREVSSEGTGISASFSVSDVFFACA